MSYKLQIKRRDQAWKTIKEDNEPRNIVVQYLAYYSNGPGFGYPLFRVTGSDNLPHLWTEVTGHMRSDRYLDKLVDQILDLVAKVKSKQ